MFVIVCRLIPRHLGNLLVFFWFTYSCNSSSVVPRSAPLRLTSRCLHGPSHAACGLAGLAVVERTALLSPPPARCVWRSLTSCHQPFVFRWVCSFLGVLHALLMIDLSSIIVYLCASLGPGAFCCVLQHHASCVHSGSSIHHPRVSHSCRRASCSFQIHHCPFG